MARYIILAIAFLLPLSFAILLVKIAIKDGGKKAFQVGMGTLFSIGVAWASASYIADWLNDEITKSSCSETDAIILGSIVLAVLLLINFVSLFYKSVQPKIAISLTYLANIGVWIFMSRYLGWVDKVVSQATVFFFLCNIVLVCAVFVLNRPPENYHKSLFYWPFNIWSVITIVVLLTFAYWHNSGAITSVSVDTNNQVKDLDEFRQKIMQEILSEQIAHREKDYRAKLAEAKAAGSIADCTAADSILLEIKEKSRQLQEIQRESQLLKPVADVVDSASQMMSDTKSMINKDGFVVGPIKKIWYGAVGQPAAKPTPKVVNVFVKTITLTGQLPASPDDWETGDTGLFFEGGDYIIITSNTDVWYNQNLSDDYKIPARQKRSITFRQNPGPLLLYSKEAGFAHLEIHLGG
ncbi:hypothetical protein COU00_00845 [Candidatus Falkowbacteria bacterium CG10_big_fil_rev_8_21_14_0_10_43_11]|uniref:Uncharacterized protein n=1 Tax=Candidatus Falkowbacteria bacterium CG10_big_fil_rev_8_21_14_0_10_43_11 TaxID=1974568 RepID=A0A2M6WMR2_9BACT|nr:MAG: hypothetical protein COU00_00845 [Candidatus Falkowbacteria bacterium CG10_big_fil_rev_8_21_14_0_10_43_11]